MGFSLIEIANGGVDELASSMFHTTISFVDVAEEMNFEMLEGLNSLEQLLATHQSTIIGLV